MPEKVNLSVQSRQSQFGLAIREHDSRIEEVKRQTRNRPMKAGLLQSSVSTVYEGDEWHVLSLTAGADERTDSLNMHMAQRPSGAVLLVDA